MALYLFFVFFTLLFRSHLLSRFKSAIRKLQVREIRAFEDCVLRMVRDRESLVFERSMRDV
jgi:hypothetical protein